MATELTRKSTVLDEATATQMAELFAVFGDPSRVRLISALMVGAQNVSTLAEVVGLSTSAVSHQMRILRHLRLVLAHKNGRHVYYALDEHVSHLYQFGLDHIRHG